MVCTGCVRFTEGTDAGGARPDLTTEKHLACMLCSFNVSMHTFSARLGPSPKSLTNIRCPGIAGDGDQGRKGRGLGAHETGEGQRAPGSTRGQ